MNIFQREGERKLGRVVLMSDSLQLPRLPGRQKRTAIECVDQCVRLEPELVREGDRRGEPFGSEGEQRVVHELQS